MQDCCNFKLKLNLSTQAHPHKIVVHSAAIAVCHQSFSDLNCKVYFYDYVQSVPIPI